MRLLLVIFATFLVSSTLPPYTTPAVHLGEVAVCSKHMPLSFMTAYGLGAVVLRSSRRIASCPTAAHLPAIDYDALIAPHGNFSQAAPGVKFCQVYVAEDAWYPALKVRVSETGVPRSQFTAALPKKIAEYAQEPAEPVVVLPSGNLFVPSHVMNKASMVCDTASAEHPSAVPPLLPTTKEFMEWGVQRLADLSFRRVVSMGDLHGDLEQTRKTLRAARLVDDAGKWVGGAAILVHTGDIVDRGKDTMEIMEWLDALQSQAAAAGGKVILLNGNHEYLLLSGDERYLAKEEKGDAHRLASHRQAFNPATGHLAKLIQSRPVAVRVGDTVFVHAGITLQWATLGIQGINENVRKALRSYIALKRQKEATLAKEFAVFGKEGPIWSRFYHKDANEAEVCGMLDASLKELQASRMVVGHSVQKHGTISTRCNDGLVMQDIAISRAFAEGGHVGFTEIRGPHLWTFDRLKWRMHQDTPGKAGGFFSKLKVNTIRQALRRKSTGPFTWPPVQEPTIVV